MSTPDERDELLGKFTMAAGAAVLLRGLGHEDLAAAVESLGRHVAETELEAHVAECAQCAGPNDGCEFGQELEDAAHGEWP